MSGWLALLVDRCGGDVSVQSESALRHVATSYAYDDADHLQEPTLRGSGEELVAALRAELQ